MGIFSLACAFANSIVTMDVLRGLQGLGASATIPASVSHLHSARCSLHAEFMRPAWYPCTRFPPITSTVNRICDFLGRCTSWRSRRFTDWWCPNPICKVRSQVHHLPKHYSRRTFHHSTTWRAPFYLTTGISALVVLGGMYSIDPDSETSSFAPGDDKRVDWLGAALVTAGLVLIMFVLGQAPVAERGWRTPCKCVKIPVLLLLICWLLSADIIALLILGVLLTAAFLYWQHFLEVNQRRRIAASQLSEKAEMKESRLRSHLPPPLMKLSLWTRANGKFAVMQTIAFLEWSSFTCWTFWAQVRSLCLMNSEGRH